jgi:DNA-binding winged helix-turn-helix (wHTH) protein
VTGGDGAGAGACVVSSAPRPPSWPPTARLEPGSPSSNWDLQTGELRRRGILVAVPEQPLRVLELLVRHAGEVVSRDQLRARLWPADTFVDFEHGLNAAVKRLRDVLGDAADRPRFVETVPKRGYRFVAPVEGLEPYLAAPDGSSLARVPGVPSAMGTAVGVASQRPPDVPARRPRTRSERADARVGRRRRRADARRRPGAREEAQGRGRRPRTPGVVGRRSDPLLRRR